MPTAVTGPYWQPEIETMPRAELAQLQAGRLQHQVEWAAGSPFYQRLWHGAPVIRTGDDVRRLPFLHKQHLVEAQLHNPPLGDLPILPVEERREVYPVHATGGTVYTVYADVDLARASEIGARILWACGLRPGDLIHNGFKYGLFAGGIFIHRAARAMGAATVPIGTDSVERQMEVLFNFKPAMVVGAPSHVLYLAERIAERGLSPRDAGVRMGLFGAEPGAGEARSRARLEQLFGFRAHDLFGMTEVSTLLAGECALQQGLHWAEDHVLVEVIDPGSLEPSRPGEPGVLVLTDLTRQNMPLLRYWTGDMATLATEPCGCGRTHARSLGGIQGRTDELLFYRGARFYPAQVGRVLARFGNVGEEYRIMLDREPGSWLDQCTLQVEMAPGGLMASFGLEERIRQQLLEETGADIAVQILHYGALGRSPHTHRTVEDRRPRS
ncbi:MAG TPA: hypothetical protein VGK74_06590 [Symbiobacteriaceae bacterium]|jgi:phenylacetate-CoA ligase